MDPKQVLIHWHSLCNMYFEVVCCTAWSSDAFIHGATGCQQRWNKQVLKKAKVASEILLNFFTNIERSRCLNNTSWFSLWLSVDWSCKTVPDGCADEPRFAPQRRMLGKIATSSSCSTTLMAESFPQAAACYKAGADCGSFGGRGSLHTEPLFLIGPLRCFTVAALEISILSAALHVVAVQLHRGVCGTLLLLHLLHAL